MVTLSRRNCRVPSSAANLWLYPRSVYIFLCSISANLFLYPGTALYLLNSDCILVLYLPTSDFILVLYLLTSDCILVLSIYLGTVSANLWLYPCLVCRLPRGSELLCVRQPAPLGGEGGAVGGGVGGGVVAHLCWLQGAEVARGQRGGQLSHVLQYIMHTRHL